MAGHAVLIRAAVLCQVLLLLAEPILTLTVAASKRPALWLLFDGTDSMEIADDLPAEVKAATDKAVGIEDANQSGSEAKSPGEGGESAAPGSAASNTCGPWCRRRTRTCWKRWASTSACRHSSSIRRRACARWNCGSGLGPIDGKHVAEQLTSTGQVTDIGGAITDLAHRNPSNTLAGLVMFSDFNKTTGPDPRWRRSSWREDLHGRPGGHESRRPGRQDRCSSRRQNEGRSADHGKFAADRAGGQTAHVRLYAQPLGGGIGSRTPVADKSRPSCRTSTQSVEFIYKPELPGRINWWPKSTACPARSNREKQLGPR